MKARLPKEYSQNRGDMMRQIQKMQDDMASMQEELAERTYTAKAGGSMVEATVKGDHTLLSVKIDPEVVDPEDTDMLGDLVVAAVNAAIQQASDDSAAEMGKITGGMDLPPGLL